MKKNRIFHISLVIIVQVITFCYYASSIIQNFSTHVFGNAQSSDSGIYLWNTFVFEKQLENLEFFFSNTNLFPVGKSMVMNTNTYPISFLNQIVNNPFLSANICLLISFVIFGLGVYLLSEKVTGHFLSSLTISLLATYTSTHLFQLENHFNLVLFFPIPYFVLTFIKAVQFKEGIIPKLNLKYILISLGILFLSILCDYHVFFFSAVFGFYYVLAHIMVFLFNQSGKKKNIITLVILLVVGHFTIKGITMFLVKPGDGFWFTPDFINFLIPKQHFLNLELFQSINNKLFERGQPFESSPFLGYSVYLLVLFVVIKVIMGKYKIEKDTLVYLTITVLFFITVFPVLKLYSKEVFYFPTAVQHLIPFLKKLRCPGRFTTMLAVFTPLTCFLLLSKTKVNLNWVAGAVLVLFLIENPKVKYSTFSAQKNETNTYLKSLETDNLFYIPVGVRDGSKEYGVFQMLDFLDQLEHRKKINNGYYSRVEKSVFEYYEKDFLWQQLVKLQKGDEVEVLTKQDALQAIIKHKINTIVLRKKWVNDNMITFIEKTFENRIRNKLILEGNIIYEL